MACSYFGARGRRSLFNYDFLAAAVLTPIAHRGPHWQVRQAGPRWVVGIYLQEHPLRTPIGTRLVVFHGRLAYPPRTVVRPNSKKKCRRRAGSPTTWGLDFQWWLAAHGADGHQLGVVHGSVRAEPGYLEAQLAAFIARAAADVAFAYALHQ